MAVFPLQPEERMVIWSILKRYPAVVSARLKLKWGIIRPSVGVHGVIEWLIGDEI